METMQEEGRPILRILNGRLAGKEYGLADRAIRIGHGIGNDVVVRGAGTRDCSVDMAPGHGAAQLRVNEGEIECLGRTLSQGEEIVLPSYLPFRLGEFWVAHGKRGSTRWDDAHETASLIADKPSVPLSRPGLLDRAMDIGAREWRQFGRIGRGGQVMLWSIAAVLLLAATGPVDSILDQAKGFGMTQGELRKAGFTNVEVSPTPAGGFVVQGLVRDDAQLARLQALVADRGANVAIDVETLPSLAAAAADILGAKGIEAKVQPTGRAGVTVLAPYLPLGQQDELRRLLKNDLPSLGTVAFRIDDSSGDNPLQRFFTSGQSSLAAVVEAGADHIVTSDGARWFEGAVLPTGHRIVKIQEGQVILEKDGRAEHLNL